MEEGKRFKDPVYGYIYITDKYIDIIDTAVFQRLRRIIQTSYAPLYSSAVHNRFVHSMGVYHLGEMAIDSIIQNSDNDIYKDVDIEKCVEIFKLACLLHDVGHAPFSHTGEQFYLKEQSDYTEIHRLLIETVNSENFEKDIPQEKRKFAAPHEIMSAIIGISEFAVFLPGAFDREFFARCITGYKYLEEKTSRNSLLNCFISLLNSKVIDVDKLDYLIRDAFIIGFDTVALDYTRLLKSVVIVEGDSDYEIAYKKTALSVIENVIYAHDAERKWIQNHPIVLYECYILQKVFKSMQEEIMQKNGINIFSKQALGNEGVQLLNGYSVRLMCDDDIIYLMKNIYPSEWSEQYFERKLRMHPVWKSEAEYKALVLNKFTENVQSKFEKAMETLVEYMKRSSDECIANDSLIDKLQDEIDKINKNEDLDKFEKKAQLEGKNGALKILKSLQKYAKDHNMSNEFVFISASQFNSGFSKPDFADTYILFDEKNKEMSKFNKVVNTFQTSESDSEKFFYLFYNRKDKFSKIDNYEICLQLRKDFDDK